MVAPTLRIASTNDLGLLLPLVRAYHAFEGINLSDEARRQALKPLLKDRKSGAIWLIETNGQPVGYIALCFGYSIEFAGGDAFIDELFVEEAFRGRGYGRAAFRLAVDEAARLNLKALHLEVARDNDRARAVYRSLGFESRDRFDLMSKKLGGEA